MNKRTVMFGALGGMTVGGVMPMLWGDYNSFGVTGILLAGVGGIVGIWLVVWLSKMLD